MVVTLILQVAYVDLAISFYLVFQLKLDEISHKQFMFYLIMCLFKSLLNVAIVSDLWSNLNFHTEKIKGIKIAALKKMDIGIYCGIKVYKVSKQSNW